MQRVDQVGGQLAVGLDARRRGGDDRRQRARIGNAIDFGPVIHVRFPTYSGLPPAAGYILPAATLWSIGVRDAATGLAAARTPRSGHEREALQRRLSVIGGCSARTACLLCV